MEAEAAGGKDGRGLMPLGADPAFAYPPLDRLQVPAEEVPLLEEAPGVRAADESHRPRVRGDVADRDPGGEELSFKGRLPVLQVLVPAHVALRVPARRLYEELGGEDLDHARARHGCRGPADAGVAHQLVDRPVRSVRV